MKRWRLGQTEEVGQGVFSIRYAYSHNKTFLLLLEKKIRKAGILEIPDFPYLKATVTYGRSLTIAPVESSRRK